jgi:hypothetical protein
MSDSYQVNLNNLMNITINNKNNVKRNINIIEKLIDILCKLGISNTLIELLDEAIKYKSITEEHIDTIQNLIDRSSLDFKTRYIAEQKKIISMSSISHFNTDLAKNIQAQSENIAIQAKLSLHDLEDQLEYNEELLSLYDMMKELVEDSCINVTISKDASNIAINKLNEFKKKDDQAREAYVTY